MEFCGRTENRSMGWKAVKTLLTDQGQPLQIESSRADPFQMCLRATQTLP